jgi:hypothetical protein
VWIIENNREEFNREINIWVENILLSDKGPYEKFDVKETVSKWLEFTDEEIQAAKTIKPKWETLKLKKFNLSFLNSQIPSLHLFSPEFQRMCHEILGRIATINEEIDVARFYYEKTFDNLSETNRAIILNNSRQTYEHIRMFAQDTADKIGILLTLEK